MENNNQEVKNDHPPSYETAHAAMTLGKKISINIMHM